MQEFKTGEASIRRVRNGWIVSGFTNEENTNCPNGEEVVYTSFSKAIAAVKSFVLPISEQTEAE